MITEIEEQDIKRGEALLRSAQTAVDDLIHEIEALAAKAKLSGDVDDKEVKQSLSTLKDLILQCIKAENYLNESRGKQVGISSGGSALDLERARAEIGCKLGRIRRCHGSGTISE